MPFAVYHFAILIVGSAAAAASVHSPCLMSSQDMQSMQMMNSEDHEKASAMHMDCMKAEVKIRSNYMIHHVCLSKIVLCHFLKLHMEILQH